MLHSTMRTTFGRCMLRSARLNGPCFPLSSASASAEQDLAKNITRSYCTTPALRQEGTREDEEMVAKNWNDWGDSYQSPSPLGYMKICQDLDYKVSQDANSKIFDNAMTKFASMCSSAEDQTPRFKAVEFGALYGNSCLGYKFGLDWDGICKVWTDENEPLNAKHDIHVIGSDFAEEPLKYAVQRGIFQEYFVYKFNTTLPYELATKLNEADMLIAMSAMSYVNTSSWMRMCYEFLFDRSKPKMIAYNVILPFDHSRNLSPDVLFAGMKNWKAESHMYKHRNFTEEEMAERDGCKECWTILYIVYFDEDTELLPI